MADLLPYLDFKVSLNKAGATPVIVLTDTSAYPAGVPPNITGFFSVTQPDGITVNGNFTTPDVGYNAGALTPKTKDMRLATDGNFQFGLWSVTYTVRATGYTDSVLTKTFSIYYKKPLTFLTSNFDVFTPSLKVKDATQYTIAGLTLNSVSRTWTALAEGVATIPSVDQDELDLIYQQNYYNAHYSVKLDAIGTWNVAGATWATLVDKITISKKYTPKVPPSLNAIYTALTAFKTSNTTTCSKITAKHRDEYVYAFTLFTHMLMRGNCGATVPVLCMVEEIYRVIQNGADYMFETTNQPIEAYAFSSFCGWGNGSGGTSADPGASSTVVELVIGAEGNYIVSADKKTLGITNTTGGYALIGKTLLSLYIEGARIPLVPRSGSVYATFNSTTGTITLTNGVFSTDAYIAINYK